jgi:hypothetical protein
MKDLVAVINALEGYKEQLELTILHKEKRSLYERLMYFTINIAKEYEVPIQPYNRWFKTYQEKKREK